MASLTGPTLVVAETFSNTVQGEGPSAGRRASFIRLGGCNLHCSWCDSKFTWDASQFDLRAEMTRRPVTELAAEATADHVGLVVITGGEPLLHQDQPGWPILLDELAACGVDIEVETNGTRAPDWHTTHRVTQFNCSPKLASGGDKLEDRFVPEALAAMVATGKAIFKFVCRDLDDLEEAATLAARAAISPRRVWIMPEGEDPATLNTRLALLADPAIARGFNLTTRLHVLCWGNERGR